MNLVSRTVTCIFRDSKNTYRAAKAAYKAARANGSVFSSVKEGVKAGHKKAGKLPTATAALGFLTGVPGGTITGLTIGFALKRVSKNLAKFLKTVKK